MLVKPSEDFLFSFLIGAVVKLNEIKRALPSAPSIWSFMCLV